MTLVDRGFVLVIRPGGQLVAAADAADRFAVLFGRLDRVNVNVVGVVVVFGAQPAAHDPLFGRFPIQNDLNDAIQFHSGFLKRLPERLRLGEISREAVQEPTAFTVSLLETVQDHRDGDRIGNEFPLVNEGFRLPAQFRSIFDIFPENDACLDVRHSVLLLYHSALCAFAASVWTKNQNVHAVKLLC